jgi:hypothetical protein
MDRRLDCLVFYRVAAPTRRLPALSSDRLALFWVTHASHQAGSLDRWAFIRPRAQPYPSFVFRPFGSVMGHHNDPLGPLGFLWGRVAETTQSERCLPADWLSLGSRRHPAQAWSSDRLAFRRSTTPNRYTLSLLPARTENGFSERCPSSCCCGSIPFLTSFPIGFLSTATPNSLSSLPY